MKIQNQTQITIRTNNSTKTLLSILLKELKEIPCYNNKTYVKILISALKFKILSFDNDITKLSFHNFFELESNLTISKVLEIDKKEMKKKYELSYKHLKYHYTDYAERISEIKKSKYFYSKIKQSKDNKQLFFKSSNDDKTDFLDLLEYIHYNEKYNSDNCIVRNEDVMLLDLTFEFLLYVSQNTEAKKMTKYFNRIIDMFDKEMSI